MTVPIRERAQVLIGDCRTVLRGLGTSTVDAVVTDPPYGLGFMGKEWDTFSPVNLAARREQQARKGTDPASATWPTKQGRASQGGGVPITYDESPSGNQRFQAWVTEWASECFRVLKPGGHLVAFGGPRTFHRLTCGLEDAGFEVRDVLSWLYGSGFPKSLDFAADLPASRSAGARVVKPEFVGTPFEAGWGTALKPGWEPIVLARKPLTGTVAGTVLEHGTGGLNIDAGRIGSDLVGWGGKAAGGNTWNPENNGLGKDGEPRQVVGRWPANVVLDEPAADLLDTQSGASRFYYTAKASRSERDAGVKGAGAPVSWSSGDASPGTFQHPNTNRTPANSHPTVKPVDLMRWLIRLVTPPGGLVLDPFLGSGTTAVAAIAEHARVTGIELDPTYRTIAQARIDRAVDRLEAAPWTVQRTLWEEAP